MGSLAIIITYLSDIFINTTFNKFTARILSKLLVIVASLNVPSHVFFLAFHTLLLKELFLVYFLSFCPLNSSVCVYTVIEPDQGSLAGRPELR